VKPELLRYAVRFHGHLGPFLLVGLRMGLLAKKKLKPQRLHEFSAVVSTPLKPPRLCVIDGLQVSSGCTTGKGNIRVEKAQQLKAEFRRGNRSITIRPRKKVASMLERVTPETTQQELKGLATRLNRLSDRELLAVEYRRHL